MSTTMQERNGELSYFTTLHYQDHRRAVEFIPSAPKHYYHNIADAMVRTKSADHLILIISVVHTKKVLQC